MPKNVLSDDIGDQYAGMATDQLYDLLGSSVHTPKVGLETNRALTLDDVARPDGARELGKRIFANWSNTLHGFLCTPTSDQKSLAQQVWDAVGKKGGFVAVLSGALIAEFGMPAAIAGIVAALVYQLVIQPAVGSICAFWGDHLSAAE